MFGFLFNFYLSIQIEHVGIFFSHHCFFRLVDLNEINFTTPPPPTHRMTDQSAVVFDRQLFAKCQLTLFLALFESPSLTNQISV